MEAEHRLAEGGLAGAALADEADDLARGDLERDIVHGVDGLAAPDLEVLGEAFDGDDGVGHGR